MFRRRASDDLPTAAGLYGRRPSRTMKEIQVPRLEPLRIVSWIWTIIGLLMIFKGYSLCKSNSEMRRLECDASMCTYKAEAGGEQREVITWPKSDLLSAEEVRVRGGEILERTVARKKKTSSTSYAIRWKGQGGTGEMVQRRAMSSKGLGRKIPRHRLAKVQEFISGKEETLKLVEDKWIDGLGLVLGMIGAILLLLRLAVGNLTEEPYQANAPHPSRRKAG